MPELPDVEGFRQHFARYASDRRIERVEVRDPTLVRNTSAQGLARALKRKRFAAPHRHGKFLFAEAEDTTVVMHFGMTGLLHWTADSEYRHQHDRVIFWLDRGQLSYRNMRKFGGIWIARGEAELATCSATKSSGSPAFTHVCRSPPYAIGMSTRSTTRCRRFCACRTSTLACRGRRTG